MKRHIPSGLSAILVLVILLIAGCQQFGLISGSGNIITKQYTFSNFAYIEVSSAFEVQITASDSYSVAVTTYENIFNYMNVTQSGNTVKIGLKAGSYTTANPKATITMPEIYGLNLSGASHGSVGGFKSTHDFTLENSGASSLDVNMDVGNTNMGVSGASKVTGQLKTADSRMSLSGASRIELTGSANNVTLEVSGAGQANLPNFSIQNASANVSGASSATVNVTGKLDADVSGASTLNYSGNPSLGKVNVTGASSLNHKQATISPSS
jgi:hypothetical protein